MENNENIVDVDEDADDRDLFELDEAGASEMLRFRRSAKKRRRSSGGQSETLYFRDYILRTMNEMLTCQLTLMRKVDRMGESYNLLNSRMKSRFNCFRSDILFKRFIS